LFKFLFIFFLFLEIPFEKVLGFQRK